MRTSAAAWEKWYREAWTQSIPAPLDMTDKEIIDWVAENAAQLTWHRGTDLKVGHWTLHSDDLPFAVIGKTLREAVQQAAAQLEAND